MNPEITNVYGNKIRVRVCGFCWQKDNLLMVNHSGIRNGDFWAPPGGGLEVGESVEQRLRQEFLEETGLVVSPGNFLFGAEFIQKPLHAIELFFNVSIVGGELKKGDDPEMHMIKAIRFIAPQEFDKMPANDLHGIFRLVETAEDFKTLNGFFRI